MLLVVLLGVCIFTSPAQGLFNNGIGTLADPYLIYTAEQINAIGADSNLWGKQ